MRLCKTKESESTEERGGERAGKELFNSVLFLDLSHSGLSLMHCWMYKVQSLRHLLVPKQGLD